MIYKVKKSFVLEWLNYRVQLEPGNFVRGDALVKGWLELDGKRVVLDDAGLQAALAVDGLLAPHRPKKARRKRGKVSN